MAVPSNDDVVTYLDTEAVGDRDNPLRHFDVRARRCRISSGMIVQGTL